VVDSAVDVAEEEDIEVDEEVVIEAAEVAVTEAVEVAAEDEDEEDHAVVVETEEEIMVDTVEDMEAVHHAEVMVAAEEEDTVNDHRTARLVEVDSVEDDEEEVDSVEDEVEAAEDDVEAVDSVEIDHVITMIAIKRQSVSRMDCCHFCMLSCIRFITKY